MLHHHCLTDPNLAARHHTPSRASAAPLLPGRTNTTARRLARTRTTATVLGRYRLTTRPRPQVPHQ